MNTETIEKTMNTGEEANAGNLLNSAELKTFAERLEKFAEELRKNGTEASKIEARRQFWDSELAQGFKTLKVKGLNLLSGFKAPVAEMSDWEKYKASGGKVCIPRKKRREAGAK